MKARHHEVIQANASNQISYESFCQAGGLSNPSLTKFVRWGAGRWIITYHYTGVGPIVRRKADGSCG